VFKVSWLVSTELVYRLGRLTFISSRRGVFETQVRFEIKAMDSAKIQQLKERAAKAVSTDVFYLNAY
jgi:hypothetical protein